MRRNCLTTLRTAILVAVVPGCGGGGGDGPIGPPNPPERVFSSLSVDPASAKICTVDPGNAVTITVTPRDQTGQPMSGLGNPSFVNSNASAVSVDASGRVRALGEGIAQITASLAAHGTTRTAAATIQVVGAVMGNLSGTVSENHPLQHIAVITAAQLSLGGALTMSIQGNGLHSHLLTLDGTQMSQIAAGCRVSQVSSLDPHSDGNGPHTHTVTFN